MLDDDDDERDDVDWSLTCRWHSSFQISRGDAIKSIALDPPSQDNLTPTFAGELQGFLLHWADTIYFEEVGRGAVRRRVCLIRLLLLAFPCSF